MTSLCITPGAASMRGLSPLPKVSVCIPVYNGERYLSQAVASVVTQTILDCEIVILDNASTDGTQNISENLQRKHGHRVRYFRNASNLGMAGNFNRSIEHASGDYVKVLCADDELLPDCLAISLAALEENPSATLVTGGRRLIDDYGRPLGVRGYGTIEGMVRGKVAIARCVYRGNVIGEPSATMFRKRDYVRLGEGFRANLPQLMDVDLWVRLLEMGGMYCIGRPICSIRVHDAQMSKANVRAGVVVRDHVRLFEEYAHKPDLQLRPTTYQLLLHRLLMTRRIWISKGVLTKEELRQLVSAHGCRLVYPLMPLVLLLQRVLAVGCRWAQYTKQFAIKAAHDR